MNFVLRPRISNPNAFAAAHRLRALLTLAAAVGIFTALAVSAIERLAGEVLLSELLDGPLVLLAFAPGVGLAAAVLISRRLAHGDGSTTDAYIRAYHDKGGHLALRRLVPKSLACIATLGAGAAMGFEGPAILVGGTFGSVAERRFGRRFRADDAKILMVAGAAAGVSAIFKAPLTGIVFALEVPYQRDLARRALIPALIASSASYVMFVSINGTQRILHTAGGSPSFDVRDLVGGLAVGVLCGILARGCATLIRKAKHLQQPLAVKLSGSAIGIAALIVVSDRLFDQPLAAGSGYTAVEWARTHPSSLGLLVALFAIRFSSTLLSVTAGGVGGLFVPLVAQGAIVGQITEALVHAPNAGLFPTVGIAAFLGAGYRTPLAGVAFVAEATGQPGFIVPALLAWAVAELFMGTRSFSPYQREERPPNITPLAKIPVAAIMTPNPNAIDSNATVRDAMEDLMRHNRRWAPVVRGEHYVGLVALRELAAVPENDRSTAVVGTFTHHDLETVGPDASLATVGDLLRSRPIGAVAVVSGGEIAGVVTVRDLANVERLNERLTDS